MDGGQLKRDARGNKISRRANSMIVLRGRSIPCRFDSSMAKFYHAMRAAGNVFKATATLMLISALGTFNSSTDFAVPCSEHMKEGNKQMREFRQGLSSGSTASLGRGQVSSHIFDLISSKVFCRLSFPGFCCGHPIPKPSSSFGFGIICTKRTNQYRLSSPIASSCLHLLERTVYVINNLVCRPPVVLQNVVVFRPGGSSYAGGDRQEFGEGIFGDVGEFHAVVLWNHELRNEECG